MMLGWKVEGFVGWRVGGLEGWKDEGLSGTPWNLRKHSSWLQWQEYVNSSNSELESGILQSGLPR